MKKSIILLLFSVMLVWTARSQVSSVSLPNAIYSGKYGKLHVQGVAIDTAHGHIYFSYTSKLIKTDLAGNLIGSVSGFLGHLGDLDFNGEDGRIYGSLEYKNDAIGKGIGKALGVETVQENGFYIAIFDVSKIVRPDMDAEKDGVVQTVYLDEPVKDYEATVQEGATTKPHRFACSGIDGLAIGPAFGKPNSTKKYLYIAYGVYGDTTRNDNDYQIILKYDIAKWSRYEHPLTQGKLHRSGPKKPLAKYFIKTGNTRWGVQSLAYDAYTGNFFAATYRGAKSQYPNYDLFVIDGHKKPASDYVLSDNKKIKVKTLSLLQAGPKDAATGIRGWYFQWGATGLCPLSNGLFYISHNGKSSDGQQETTIHKYRWVGDETTAFELVKN